MMQFLGFGAAAAKPETEEYVIPSESALIEALLTAYHNPAIMTTEAMQLEVSARHPTWTVSLKRVRKLLCKVVTQHDAEAWVACGEDEVEDWCVIRAPVVVAKAESVSALWAARRSAVQLTTRSRPGATAARSSQPARPLGTESSCARPCVRPGAS